MASLQSNDTCTFVSADQLMMSVQLLLVSLIGTFNCFRLPCLQQPLLLPSRQVYRNQSLVASNVLSGLHLPGPNIAG